MFWIHSRLNTESVIGTGGSARKSLFFNIFTQSRIFAYFPYFKVFAYVEQIKKLSFRLK